MCIWTQITENCLRKDILQKHCNNYFCLWHRTHCFLKVQKFVILAFYFPFLWVFFCPFHRLSNASTDLSRRVMETSTFLWTEKTRSVWNSINRRESGAEPEKFGNLTHFTEKYFFFCKYRRHSLLLDFNKQCGDSQKKSPSLKDQDEVRLL